MHKLIEYMVFGNLVAVITAGMPIMNLGVYRPRFSVIVFMGCMST